MRLPALFIVVLCCTGNAAVAQQPGMPARGTTIDVYGIMGVPLTTRKSEVEGSPMISDEWGKGYILFKTGRKISDVELNFSLLENTFYFRKDKDEFGFADELKEGEFTVNNNKGNKTYLFRCGYPISGKPGVNAFFQVLAEGPKYQLLKFIVKKVDEQWQYNESAKYVFKLTQELYLYDVRKDTVTKFNKDKNALAENFTTDADKAKQFMAQKKYRFRSDDEIVELVNMLNQ